jgi:hypothetical protein
LNTAAFGSNVGTAALRLDVTRLSSVLLEGGTTSNDLSGSVFGISLISLNSSAIWENLTLRVEASSIKLALRRSCSSMSVRRRAIRLGKGVSVSPCRPPGTLVPKYHPLVELSLGLTLSC